MRLAIISNFFGPEEKGIPKIAEIGFDTVEVPNRYVIDTQSKELIKKCKDCAISIHSMMASTAINRELVSANEAVREGAIRKIKGNIEWANQAGAQVVQIVPGWGIKEATRSDVIEVLRRVAIYAEDHSITLALEPCNKFETFYMHNLHHAVEIVKEVNSKYVKAMGDTFHMHIQERNPVRAIWEAKDWLVHFHLSDNDRLPPGLGCVDLKAIIDVLCEIDYEGSLSLSEIRPVPSHEAAAKLSYNYVRALMEISKVGKYVI